MKIYQLFEGISPVVYHYTTIHKATSILQDDKFKLSTSFGTDAEGWLKQKEKIYYLSTTRHKLGGYHLTPGREGVMFTLDGRALSHKYSGDPVDYWGEEFRKLKPSGAESEDRIYHTEPEIPNASKYIKEAHVYVKASDLDNRTTSRTRKLLLQLKKKSIPTFFYDNYKDWLIQNKNKSTKFPHTYTQSPGPGYHRQRKPFAGYKELFHKSTQDQLSKDGNHELKYLYNKRDFISQLKANIHNHKSRVEESGLDGLLKLFKQLNLKSANDVFDYLYDKWVKGDK